MTFELPTDLMMPASCPACSDSFNVPVEEVVLAITEHKPIDCPHCHGAQLAVTRLEEVSFFSQAEWDAWDDEDPTAEVPPHYHLAAIVEVRDVVILPPMSMN